MKSTPASKACDNIYFSSGVLYLLSRPWSCYVCFSFWLLRVLLWRVFLQTDILKNRGNWCLGLTNDQCGTIIFLGFYKFPCTKYMNMCTWRWMLTNVYVRTYMYMFATWFFMFPEGFIITKFLFRNDYQVRSSKDGTKSMFVYLVQTNHKFPLMIHGS